MEATEAFQSILDSVMSSQLNFHLQLSPFSAVISLKKSFLRDKTGRPLFPPPSTTPKLKADNDDLQDQNDLLAEEVASLKSQIQELIGVDEASKDTIELLEDKIAKIEAHALKTYEEKKTEEDVYKNKLKTMNCEIVAHKTDLTKLKKSIKEKDKQIIKLEIKCENLESNVKWFKSDISDLKTENKKLIKGKFPQIKKKDVSTNTFSVSIDSSGQDPSSMDATSIILGMDPTYSLLTTNNNISLGTNISSSSAPITYCSLDSPNKRRLDPSNKNRLGPSSNSMQDPSNNSILNPFNNSNLDSLNNISLNSPQNLSLGTIKNTKLDLTTKSSQDLTSRSLSQTTCRNTNNEGTENFTEVFNDLANKLSMKIDDIGLKYQEFHEELKRR